MHIFLPFQKIISMKQYFGRFFIWRILILPQDSMIQYRIIKPELKIYFQAYASAN